jgi:hypothetical protein
MFIDWVRNNWPAIQALAEAKAVTKAMSDEEMCAYVTNWFRREQAVVAA